MAVEPEDHIAEIVSAAGGKIVSKIRLQKIAYLIDQVSGDHSFDFVYYHYGPYSRDVENAVVDAKASNLIQEQELSRVTDGAKYSIFTMTKPVENYHVLKQGKLRELVADLSKENATVLELAATAHWLVKYENIDSWDTEIKRRKGSKNDNGRLEKAIALLQKLSLTPFEALKH